MRRIFCQCRCISFTNLVKLQHLESLRSLANSDSTVNCSTAQFNWPLSTNCWSWKLKTKSWIHQLIHKIYSSGKGFTLGGAMHAPSTAMWTWYLPNTLFFNIKKCSCSSKIPIVQDAKKVSFTACHSGKLQLACTSPLESFWWTGLITVFLYMYVNFICASGNLRTEITYSIAKSTSPGLSDMTFSARWLQCWYFHHQSDINYM